MLRIDLLDHRKEIVMNRSRTWIKDITPPLPDKIRILCPGDVHLFGDNRAKALIEILRPMRTWQPAQLHELTIVLNGDFLDTTTYSRIVKRARKKDLRVIELLEQLRHRGATVLYNRGNHDVDIQSLLCEVTSRVRDQRVRYNPWELRVLETLSCISHWKISDTSLVCVGNARLFFIHGDQWDHLVHDHLFLTEIGAYLWELIKRIDTEEYRFAMYVKRNSKAWTRVSWRVATGAMETARLLGANYAIAGHTHDPFVYDSKNGVYINVGSFDMRECGLLTCDSDGHVQLHRVDTYKKHRKNPRKH